MCIVLYFSMRVVPMHNSCRCCDNGGTFFVVSPLLSYISMPIHGSPQDFIRALSSSHSPVFIRHSKLSIQPLINPELLYSLAGIIKPRRNLLHSQVTVRFYTKINNVLGEW